MYRLWLVGAGAAVTVGVLLAAFPELVDGPLGRVDPLYRELRLDQVVRVDAENNLLFVAGAVPGHNKGIVKIRRAVAAKKK